MTLSQNEKIPQWLNEVISRGFSPKREISCNDDYSLFTYVEPGGFSFQKAYRFFVLEGIPGAGKTTLYQRLSKIDKIICVKQILPEEPAGALVNDQSYYFTSDELKTKVLLNNIGATYVFDRYYVSTLGYCYASDACFRTNLFHTAFLWYKKGLEFRRLFQPFATILLDVDVSLSLERKNRKSLSSDPWSNKSFLQVYRHFYDAFYKKIETSCRVYRIDATRHFEDVYQEVYGIITKNI